MGVKVEIVCVGNELLIGKTMNTNAHWLARRITLLGATVQRITVISDKVTEIASVIREALKRKPLFIITTGGLGPTFDDITLKGIAKGLGRKFEVNKDALEMVKQRYVEYLKEGRIEKAELTPSRVKMAMFPEEAKPLANSVGTAPGMVTKTNQAFVIALPGVPPEMESIFEKSVVPLLKKKTRGFVFLEESLFVDGVVESNLAPLIDEVMRSNPRVYVKSHVYVKSQGGVEGKKSHIELHFSVTARNSKTALNFLHSAIIHLGKLARKIGGRIAMAEVDSNHSS